MTLVDPLLIKKKRRVKGGNSAQDEIRHRDQRKTKPGGTLRDTKGAGCRKQCKNPRRRDTLKHKRVSKSDGSRVEAKTRDHESVYSDSKSKPEGWEGYNQNDLSGPENRGEPEE